MFHHAPKTYNCPFCALLSGKPDKLNSLDDIFFQNEHISAFVSPKWWPNIDGNVIIITNKHFENLYELPKDYGHAVFDAVKEIALAFKKEYKSDGVSTRQHNEPAGLQEVWHYHYHVIPRYHGDELYSNYGNGRWVPASDRAKYAKRLRLYFKTFQKRTQ